MRKQLVIINTFLVAVGFFALLLAPGFVSADMGSINGVDVSDYASINGVDVADYASINGQALSGAAVADQILRPAADYGVAWSCSTGSSRYALVDEESPDGDTTYIYRQESFQFQTFTNLPTLPDGSIVSVQVHFNAKVESGDVNGFGRLFVNGTAYNATGQALTGSYANYYSEWTTNPDTGSAWTKADVEGTGSNAIENWGIGANPVSGEEARVSQVYLKVVYN